MKTNIFKFAIVALIATAIFSCTKEEETSSKVEKSAILENYASIVYANYLDAFNTAKELQNSINRFISSPSASTFAAAKVSWKASREPYGLTEAFRFANGPIDADNGPEGALNAWPLDETHIDNILAGPDVLSKEYLEGKNEEGDIAENVSIGYHAIEYLLWGSDLTEPLVLKPGQRAYTDFVGSESAPTRKREYLALCAALIVDHLQLMLDEWKNGGNYRTTFLGLDKNTALDNMISSIAELAGSELAHERMQVALTNHDQEDEHSCFSDNTHRDIRLNLYGVVNVYYGTYGTISGASLNDLVMETNEQLGEEISNLFTQTITSTEATGIPFDFAISSGQPGENAKVQKSINDLKALGDKLSEAKTALGL